MSQARSVILLVGITLALALLGCGGSKPSPRGPEPTAEVDLATAEPGSATSSGFAESDVPPPGGDAQIPITSDDPRWGSPSAPATLVAFVDFQCPFCARAESTIEDLKRHYGPARLRVVYKHNPLPFHRDALPAALAAQAVYEVAGSEAFFAYVKHLYANARNLSDANLLDLAGEVGVSRGALRERLGAPQVRAKVRADMVLAQATGARGTPTFFINGSKLVGARPPADFQAVIDSELEAAAALEANGVPAVELYTRRVQKNYEAPAPSQDSPRPEAPEDDTTVYKVPVGKSPTRGPKNALVTIVEFSDFQCPFCERVQPTLEEVMKRYKGDVRLVFKHNPLPFHQRAEPASQLAIEARVQRGDTAFWRTHDLLFAADDLEDDDLTAIAKQLGLNPARAKRAITQQPHQAVIDADQKLAADVDARGTPQFFINGRRLRGAQPLEKFVELIDEQLALARKLMKTRGIPAHKVYAELMKTAQGPKPPPTKSVAGPTGSAPTRGPKSAPVTVQIFSDFECPFCKRVVPTIEALEKKYKGKLRIVWRNLPLPFHQHARVAASAALEARAQKGDRAFWEMHDLIYANLSSNRPDRATLRGYAKKLGLNLARFEQALDGGRHDAAIDADLAAAKAAGISGTPAFVINGYFISGAQPLTAFENAVDQALDDIKHGRKVP